MNEWIKPTSRGVIRPKPKYQHLLDEPQIGLDWAGWLEHLSISKIIVFICFQCVITQSLSEWEADGRTLIPHTGRWHQVSSQLKATCGSFYPTSSIRPIFQMSSWAGANRRQAAERVAGDSSVVPLSVCLSHYVSPCLQAFCFTLSVCLSLFLNHFQQIIFHL